MRLVKTRRRLRETRRLADPPRWEETTKCTQAAASYLSTLRISAIHLQVLSETHGVPDAPPGATSSLATRTAASFPPPSSVDASLGAGAPMRWTSNFSSLSA
jgi:hypothetical protein